MPAHNDIQVYQVDNSLNKNPSMFLPDDASPSLDLSPVVLPPSSDDDLELTLMSEDEMLKFVPDWRVKSKRYKFKIDILYCTRGPDSSWRKAAIPSHGTCDSVREFILDKMEVPRTKHEKARLQYTLGDVKGVMRFDFDEENWLELRKEVRLNLEAIQRNRRTKRKLPLYVRMLETVSIILISCMLYKSHQSPQPSSKGNSKSANTSTKKRGRTQRDDSDADNSPDVGSGSDDDHNAVVFKGNRPMSDDDDIMNEDEGKARKKRRRQEEFKKVKVYDAMDKLREEWKCPEYRHPMCAEKHKLTWTSTDALKWAELTVRSSCIY